MIDTGLGTQSFNSGSIALLVVDKPIDYNTNLMNFTHS